jgi:predicted DNA-binding transcriptional regulator AlpA
LITSTVPPDLTALSELLDVKQVAALCNCSERHVHRMHDRGAMPAALRPGGHLLRWSKRSIIDWIAAGCRPVRQAGRE